MRAWRGRLLLLAGSVGAALLLAELGLRLAAPQPTGATPFVEHPTLVTRMAPGASGRISLPGVYAYRWAHDADGMRTAGRSLDGRSPDDDVAEGSVLILGDSFAYGMGVEADETLASRLSESLGTRGANVRVRNGAAVGKGPAYALRLLETVGRSWRGDAVVYVFYPNDFANLRHRRYAGLGPTGHLVHPRGDAPNVRRRARLGNLPGMRWVAERSHVAGLVRRAALAAAGANGLGPETVDLDTTATPVAYHTADVLPLAGEVFAALDSTVQARGGRLITLYAPSAAEVAYTRRTGAPSADERAFDRVRRTLGLDGVTTTPALAASELAVGQLYYPEIHWRPPAHALAASTVLDPVQAAVCERDLSRRGCDRAPEAVRRTAAMRARPAGESTRRTPAD